MGAIALMAVAGIACHSCAKVSASDVKAYYQAENLGADEAGRRTYRQSFFITGDTRNAERLCFNQFARRMTPADSTDTLIELVPGYYAIATPRLAAKAPTDTLRIDIYTQGTLRSVCYEPDGVHLVQPDGTFVPVLLKRFDISANPRYYADDALDRMPYGDAVYAENERISGGNKGVYDVVPSFKSIETDPAGKETYVDPVHPVFVEHNSLPEGAYRLVIKDNAITVYAPKHAHEAIGVQLLRFFGDAPRMLPEATLYAAPDLEYRGLMLDVARNFQSVAEVKRVLYLMASYGLNTLHFHPVDDEAWRLEIAGLPELTEVGARRGYVTDSIAPMLPRLFAGTPNGYYTREQFRDILRYAKTLNIKVIPEIESPGHARAAIKALQYSHAANGGHGLLLSHAGDTSAYTSAQNFHDNVMNPALEDTYTFLGKVFDSIIEDYKEVYGADADVTIHIGGDEVPRGAWSGSGAVADLMKRHGLVNEKEVHAYFVERVADMLAERGATMAGWQEIALGHSSRYNDHVRPGVYSVNCWSTLPSHGHGGVIEAVAGAGYPIVLSNVDHFYFDMTYSYHPEERGLSWGGTTDELSALHGYPARLCPFPDATVKGIQAQVFAETIRNSANLEELLLPKLAGLSERAWNADSTYTDADFNAVSAADLRYWADNGYAYHVRQPGIKLSGDGKTFKVNAAYPDATVRYTLDGSRPDADAPIAVCGEDIAIPAGTKTIRATAYYLGRKSVPTIVFVSE